MDAESPALAALASIRLCELAPTDHFYGPFSWLHGPFCEARYIHRTSSGDMFEHRLTLGAVSGSRSLEILRYRFRRERTNGFAFRAAARRNPSNHQSARHAGADLYSVLPHSFGDSDCVLDVENPRRLS